MNEDGVLVVDDLVDAAGPALRWLPSPERTKDLAVVTARRKAWLGKRAADVVLSLLLLVITLPLFLLIAIVIKLTSAGPVLFRHRRVGRGGEDFSMLKFRTMEVDSEERLRSDGALQELFLQNDHKIPCQLDPRLTSTGRILRRLSLDELPQLLNVLAGHMSMVGPRPVVRPEFDRDYRGYESAYLGFRPGLTGLWQVSGRSTVQFPERAELDAHYALACGPWIDARIILRTPIAIVTGQGAG